MQSFKDRNGKPWTLDITIGCALRVKADSGGKFDLFEPQCKIGERPLSTAIYDDLPTFWELLWHLVAPAATSAEINAATFGEAMAADCLITARNAFLLEWVAFFRGLRREELAIALEKVEAGHLRLQRAIQARGTGPELTETMQRMESYLETETKAAFSSLRDSFPATPVPGPGDSLT